jgi:hypothetical protein
VRNRRPTRSQRPLPRLSAALTGAALAAVWSLAPLHAAHAYVDPNSAGMLYQILFPILVAIASMFTVLRRSIARLWNRVVGWLWRAPPREVDQDPRSPQ